MKTAKLILLIITTTLSIVFLVACFFSIHFSNDHAKAISIAYAFILTDVFCLLTFFYIKDDFKSKE